MVGGRRKSTALTICAVTAALVPSPVQATEYELSPLVKGEDIKEERVSELRKEGFWGTITSLGLGAGLAFAASKNEDGKWMYIGSVATIPFTVKYLRKGVNARSKVEYRFGEDRTSFDREAEQRNREIKKFNKWVLDERGTPEQKELLLSDKEKKELADYRAKQKSYDRLDHIIGAVSVHLTHPITDSTKREVSSYVGQLKSLKRQGSSLSKSEFDLKVASLTKEAASHRLSWIQEAEIAEEKKQTLNELIMRYRNNPCFSEDLKNKKISRLKRQFSECVSIGDFTECENDFEAHELGFQARAAKADERAKPARGLMDYLSGKADKINENELVLYVEGVRDLKKQARCGKIDSSSLFQLRNDIDLAVKRNMFDVYAERYVQQLSKEEVPDKKGAFIRRKVEEVGRTNFINGTKAIHYVGLEYDPFGDLQGKVYFATLAGYTPEQERWEEIMSKERDVRPNTKVDLIIEDVVRELKKVEPLIKFVK
ncbi:hypothetical protein ACFLZ7_01220 [Nanoarchaeota archaeon]